MWDEFEFDEDYVRYTLIPTIVIQADDNKMYIGVEWLSWGFGFTIFKENN